MSPRRSLLAVVLVCATRSAAADVPADCAPIVNSASRSYPASAEAMRRCVAALRADEPARAPEPTRPGPARPVRQFAVLRELGELRIRPDAATASRAAVSAAEDVAAPETCALSLPGAASVPSADCLRCHPRQGHQVDIDYASAYARASWSLRTEEEVVRRGVLLPHGRLECVTCHDGRSPWKYKLALPPGAAAIPAVVTGRRETYEGGRTWRTASASTVPLLPPGTQVSPSPLCAACHPHAD